MTPAVGTTIEALYVAFANVPCPKAIAHSPVKKPEDLPPLHVQLRVLTGNDLSSYHHAVYYTIDETGFGYFLPRLIELVHDPASILEWEIVHHKIGMYLEQSATNSQRIALLHYADTVWNSLTEEENEAIDAVLCGLASLTPDMARYLPRLLAGTDAARANVQRLYEANATTLPYRLSNAFWDRQSAAYATTLAWLCQKVELGQR